MREDILSINFSGYNCLFYALNKMWDTFNLIGFLSAENMHTDPEAQTHAFSRIKRP